MCVRVFLCVRAQYSESVCGLLVVDSLDGPTVEQVSEVGARWQADVQAEPCESAERHGWNYSGSSEIIRANVFMSFSFVWKC